MKLQIVWRNPQPIRTGRVMVKQTAADADGALFGVLRPREIKVLESLEYRAAEQLGGTRAFDYY